MAPELILSLETLTPYDNKIDLWALGILAIELANKSPPYFGLDAMSAVYYITKNPPPTLDFKLSPIHNINNQNKHLHKNANHPNTPPTIHPSSPWTPTFHSFVTTCLVKDNPQARPPAKELLNHPFISENSNINSVRDLLRATRTSTALASSSKASLQPSNSSPVLQKSTIPDIVVEDKKETDQKPTQPVEKTKEEKEEEIKKEKSDDEEDEEPKEEKSLDNLVNDIQLEDSVTFFSFFFSSPEKN